MTFRYRAVVDKGCELCDVFDQTRNQKFATVSKDRISRRGCDNQRFGAVCCGEGHLANTEFQWCQLAAVYSRHTSPMSSSFWVIRKQQCSITAKPILTDWGITVKTRTAAKRLFLIFLEDMRPSRPLSWYNDQIVCLVKGVTNLISSILRRQSETKPCTRRSYPSRASRVSERGRSSKAFKEGRVGPTKSTSDDSSFSNSVAMHQSFPMMVLTRDQPL